MLIRPKSTIEIRNKTYKFNLPRNNNKLIKFNTNQANLDIHQSPKISSEKMRYILNNKKLFSLIDLNEKVTNSKGPSLPIQFKRLTSEEINDMFNGNLTQAYETVKNLKYSSMKDNILGKIRIPKAVKKESYVFNKESKTLNNNDFYDRVDNDMKDKMLKIKRPNSTIYSYKLHSKNLLKKKEKNSNINISENEKTDINDEKKVNTKNDIWMPANYKDFEQIVKDRKLFKKKMKENPFFNRLPSCTLKEIQSKSYKSDIFFFKPPPNADVKSNSFRSFMKNFKSQKPKASFYNNSDIFNLKNDEVNLKKVGEKYLFYAPQKMKYTASRESNSEWKSQIMEKSMNNCSSKKYNILTPNRKNSNLSKEEFYKTLNEAKDNRNNPISKPRSISKFIDLANHSSSNFGKDYMNCYNANPDCFKKVPEFCSSFGDLYLQYKNLCDRPFYRNNIFALK